jgi:6-phosphogluconolactonase (cycloisomerase 2 family)
MNRAIKFLLLVFAAATLCAVAGAQSAQTLYANDDIVKGNTLSAYRVHPDTGKLTPLPGSPYSTGGTGLGGGFFMTPRVTARSNGSYLWVTNSGDNTISTFRLNADGIARLVGTPVSSGNGLTEYGIGIAVTPNAKFLYADNTASLTSFSIDAHGGLTQIGTAIDTPAGDGMEVTHNGKYLYIAYPLSNQIGAFSIDESTGALTPVSGQPFAAAGSAAGLIFNCADDHMFIGDAEDDQGSMEVYSIGSDGTLTAVPGSPFTTYKVYTSNGVLLSHDEKFLYSTDQGGQYTTAGGHVVTWNVHPDFTLNVNHVSKDGRDTTNAPAGMSINRDGDLVFTGNYDSGISNLGVLKVNAGGGLKQVDGSPFATAPGATDLSVLVLPGPRCP